MQERLLFNSKHFDVTIKRLCYQLIENHDRFSDSAIIGLQPRGIFAARRIQSSLTDILGNKNILLGELDVTFYRDDYRRREIISPSITKLDFLVEKKNVILVDDVLFTGRTIRAGMDALIDFGRPEKVELLVLVDRRYSRHLPIEPDYIGIQVDTITSDKVKVRWKETDGEDAIWLINDETNKSA
ncbi:MAG: bifunctional pyr operon transcriptional regulator/uracil phosphoribosyltransferase PyrR [Bacteroidia bacterium]|nr:bifunctional pyr operon transcriptional regulator/uracil phosphoribosyltransferase PyrR [Bacteroidia bacterium]